MCFLRSPYMSTVAMPLAWDNFNQCTDFVGLGLMRSSSSFNPLPTQQHDSWDAAAPSTLSDVAVLHHRILYWYRHPVDKQQLNVCTATNFPFSPKGRCSRMLRLLTPLSENSIDDRNTPILGCFSLFEF